MPQAQWTPRVRRVDQSETSQLSYAYSLMRERRFDEAREEVEKVLLANDRSFAANMALGMILQRQRNHPEALHYFDRAMSLDGMNPRAPVMAGFSHMAMNEADRAATLFREAINIDPKLVGAHLGCAQALQRSGQEDGAVEHLKEALRYDPQFLPARMMLARMDRRAGADKEAIAELEMVLETNPGHPSATLMLAGLLERSGELTRATDLLDTATHIHTENVRLWKALGRLRMTAKDYAGAERVFREVIRLRPRDTTATLRLIAALIPQRKLEEATDLLKRMPRRGRTAPSVHKAYGDIFAANNLMESAAKSYRAALLARNEGAEVVAEIEKELPPSEGNWDQLVKKYQDVMEERAKKLRDSMGTEEMQKGMTRIREQMSERLGEGWFRSMLQARRAASQGQGQMPAPVGM